jgi:GT2 family glycosyltransferase
MRFLDSLALQDARPAALIVVDASPDQETESAFRGRDDMRTLAVQVSYFRVKGEFKGLTRQRNLGTRSVTTDLVAFFDDDVVLRPGCLREMEAVLRDNGTGAVGVGAYTDNGYSPPTGLWRLRKALRIVSDLRPGSYQRSGMSVGWNFLAPTDQAVEGDWLSGCAMMWRTETLREVGFFDAFEGYAQGEDLDFSLQAKKKGKLFTAGKARVLHLFDEGGRPDHFRMGYMAIHNRYNIHRRGLESRSWRDVGLFVYAWTFDTILLTRRFFLPGHFTSTAMQIAGRLRATFDLVRGH